MFSSVYQISGKLIAYLLLRKIIMSINKLPINKKRLNQGGLTVAQKILMICICLSVFLFISESGYAKVSGTQCSSCHTMHNSQDGSTQRAGKAGEEGLSGSAACNACHITNRPVLLKMDCLGCHAENPAGPAIGSFNTPQVAYTTDSVAAGNFKNVFGGDDEKGHNIHGFISDAVNDHGTDPIYTNTGNYPPGYDSAYDPSTAKWSPTNDGMGGVLLLCAGANGCHGNRDETSIAKAMKGTHHADDSSLKFGTIDEGTQGATVGKSYRFLRGIHGGESPDWEKTKTSTDHNEYKGKTFAARASQSWGAMTGTISEFCAECHGGFHASAGITGGSGSPWLRHPTDALLPGSGEYSAFTTWSPIVAVARPTIPAAASAAVNPGTDVVMCLSCHKAHASEYPDSLRWDFPGVARPTGCVTCHTTK